MGFQEYKIELDEEHRHAEIVIYNQPPAFDKEWAPFFVEALNHLFQVIAQKENVQALFADVNNYRREREKLIQELARAAARKVTATKGTVTLPAMNSYERRIIHTELSLHPTIKTESEGEGKERKVIVKMVG
jgi:spoIIIJ-associated protein